MQSSNQYSNNFDIPWRKKRHSPNGKYLMIKYEVVFLDCNSKEEQEKKSHHLLRV